MRPVNKASTSSSLTYLEEALSKIEDLGVSAR
jgi:hypothetical protein